MLAIPFMWMGCEKDVKILDDYKDITIVYGLINPNDSVSYIRIEKAFLTNENILISADIQDSNQYSYKLDVKLKSGNQQITFDTVTIFNKNEGVFYAPKMQVYYAVTKNLLDTDNEYELEIVNPENNNIITSSSMLHNSARMTFSDPRPTRPISFEGDQSIEFETVANARVYQLNLRFHYMEQVLNDTTTRTYHYVDWIFPSYNSRDLSGGEDMYIPYEGDEFYANLINNIPLAGNSYRYYGEIDVIVSTADDTFNTYMEVNEPSSSLVIDRVEYTNIVNGYGLFAGRSNGGGLHPINGVSKLRIEALPGLNFVGGIPE